MAFYKCIELTIFDIIKYSDKLLLVCVYDVILGNEPERLDANGDPSQTGEVIR